MTDYQASIEKLRNDAAEAAHISGLATDRTKRELYSRLHQHLNRLADEVDRAMRAVAPGCIEFGHGPGRRSPVPCRQRQANQEKPRRNLETNRAAGDFVPPAFACALILAYAGEFKKKMAPAAGNMPAIPGSILMR